jgi:hypothetical protein
MTPALGPNQEAQNAKNIKQKSTIKYYHVVGETNRRFTPFDITLDNIVHVFFY